MFTPAARTRSSARKVREGNVTDSPTSGLVAGTPPTPAITKHSSMAFRMASILKSGDKSAANGCDPVFVCEFPQQLRKLVSDTVPPQRSEVRGGMDEETGLSWIMWKNQIFVWSHLNRQASAECKILSIPPQLCTRDGESVDPRHGTNWLVRMVNRQDLGPKEINLVKGSLSASLMLCSQKTFAVVYWPDIYKDTELPPVVSTGVEEKLLHTLDSKYGTRRSSSTSDGNLKPVNSLLVSGTRHLDCVAIASCSTNLWRLDCSPAGISHQSITRDTGGKGEQSFGPFDFNTSDVARSLVWRSRVPKNGWQEFLLLTSRGFECWDVQHFRGGRVTRAWGYDISEDVEVLKDLTAQKQVWLLDLQATAEKNITVLAASLSKDRVTNSSYMQYSLLTFLCTPTPNRQGGEPEPQAKCVKKKASAQVILPKARVEEEEFLYAMQLRVGGKPAGSALILSADGTATISHYLHGVGRLYQFDLAWDAGRVLDASIVPSTDENDEGAWLVLTEKAGVWAIPEKAVLLGAVEPPERSLSRKGSASDDSSKEQRRRLTTSNGSERTLTRIVSQRPLQDEEAEALIGRLFQSYLTTRQASGVHEKLQRAGAFEEGGEMNIFARFSKSIVDTIAKHWASGGVGAAITMAITSQLTEKQKRHQQYLNFLAASNCHEFLRYQQRNSLHTILEHGEKLAAILKIKDTYNSRTQVPEQSEPVDEQGDSSGAVWDTIQLVGETARRKNVMLMDKEKVEVFFTRVSNLEEFFGCIDEHSQAIISKDQSTKTLLERVCELADACKDSIRSAREYRDSQQSWYPSPEGLTSWYCKPAVRAGLWKIACHLMELQTETDFESKEKLMARLAEIADVLLEGYSGAIAAKVEREEEYRGLQSEYWSRRDSILAALQHHDKEVANLAAQSADGEEASEEQRFEVLRGRYSQLLALARRHAGYQTLWEVCIDLNDMDFLRQLMHESMGLKEGRFSIYVFEQFSRTGQYAKLLRLGEEFKEDLAQFLQDRKTVSWLHDIYLQRFSVAADTMHSLAFMNEDVTVPVNQDQGSATVLSLARRRKLLYLAKLSALSDEKHDKAVRIDADLGILSVQEAAVELGLATSAEILSPLQLVELCLSSDERDLVLRSLEVFALAGEIFRRGNKSLLEAAWLKLADQDEWLNMRRMSEEEAWSDEQQYEALKSTAIFAASRYCYGGTPFIVGMPFEATLPAFRENRDMSMTLRAEPGSAGGVDEVLMQHQDFPEAGEAMIMALRMGKGLELSSSDNMEI